MALSESIKRLRARLDDQLMTLPPYLAAEGRPKDASSRVLVRDAASYLSANPLYSEENYRRRQQQRTRGFLAVDNLPYKTLGNISLDPYELIEESFYLPLMPAADEKESVRDALKKESFTSASVPPHTVLNKVEESESSFEEEPQKKLDESQFGGLSSMRLVLGANDRRIHAQHYSKVHFQEALRKEKRRMEYLKTMWSHSAEKGHHPSKYLNPMVHTSSSKECLVLSSSKDKTALSPVHQEGTKEDTQEETAQSSVVTGAAGNTPLQLSVAPGDGRRRTNRSSFFVTLAASNFKRRPTHHNKKIKKLAEEQFKFDSLIAKISAIFRIFCALTNIRNKDLRSKHPILSDVLNQMMSKPNEAFVAGKLNHPCQPVMPAIHSRSSPLKSASTEHAYQHKHEQPTNLAVPGRQKPFLSLTKKGHPCSGVHYKVNFNGNSSHQVARIPPLLDNTSVCEDVEQYSLKPARNKSLSSLKGSHSKPYSAGHLSSKETPLWQRPIVYQDGSVDSTLSLDPRERILRIKQLFQDVKNKQAQILNEKLKEMDEDAAESFIQKLKEVQFGPLAQVNLDQMRQKANQNIRKLKMKEDNKPMWYLKLESEIDSLSMHKNNEKLLHLMKKLQTFEDLDEIRVQHLKEKTCLFVMSLPAYYVAQENMVEAIMFVLNEVLKLPPQLLEVWMKARRLPLIFKLKQTMV